MSADHKLGVCVVGCGDMGTRHARFWSEVPEARVVAVADINAASAEKLASAHHLQTWTTDYRQAVSLPEVNVVSVCIPTCSHPEVTIYAANLGKHVLCEKPIALTLAEAQAMRQAARQNGVKLGLGFMRRYSPVLACLREWVSTGRLGRPLLYCASDAREIRPKREMHNALGNGGPVIDMGVHLFDGWAFLFDSRPVEVFARGFKLARDRPELSHFQHIACDTATLVVTYASGDVGSFVVSWGLPPGINPPVQPDQIFGPGGVVQLSLGIDHQEARLTGENPDSPLISSSGDNMYRLEIADFARCILEDRPPRTTAEDGQAALQVALAALESIQTGQPVKL